MWRINMAAPPFDRPEPPTDEELLGRLAYESEETQKRRRVRLCPLCAEAALEESAEESSCDIHGDPYEGPSAPELTFHALFGRFPWELPMRSA